MGNALPVDCLACLQMVTTSSGSTYHGARTGTRLCSNGVSTRVGSSTYFPTKSLWGVAGVISSFSGILLLARIVNIPATTVSGRKLPESRCVVDTRITFPELSILVGRCAAQELSLTRR